MIKHENRDAWKEVKEIWENSSKGDKINLQISTLINELKGKMSPFEKRSIKSDITKIQSAWNQDLKKVSQFEKDSVSKDFLIITNWIKKILKKLKLKK